MGSSCYCLSLGFVVVRRSFSGGNQEEGPACLYSYLISSLLPKSISSQLLHCVTSLPFGSVWEWEAWRQKEGEKKEKPTRIPAKCLPLPLALCAQGKQSQLSATCLSWWDSAPAGALCCPGTDPSPDGHVPFVTTAEHTSGGVSPVALGLNWSLGQEWDGAGSQSRGVGVCDSSGAGQGAEVGGVTAGTLVGRVQELGMGRMWSCWGQVGSYRILHMEMLVGSPRCPQCWL